MHSDSTCSSRSCKDVALNNFIMQAVTSGDNEKSIEAIRRQIQVEIMGKMKDDRSSGAVARAKAEAEAKAKCVQQLSVSSESVFS